jgi:transcriptional regulator with XRE-family HTH domain
MDKEPIDGAADLAKVRALGHMVQRKRTADRLTLAQAADQSGVSAPTLSRLERLGTTKAMKGPIPDTRTLTLVAQWLGVSLEEALEGGPKRPQVGNPNIQEGGSTPEIVRAHLRADRNLDSTTAAMLAQMFELAYKQYSQLSGNRLNAEPDQDHEDEP